MFTLSLPAGASRGNTIILFQKLFLDFRRLIGWTWSNIIGCLLSVVWRWRSFMLATLRLTSGGGVSKQPLFILKGALGRGNDFKEAHGRCDSAQSPHGLKVRESNGVNRNKYKHCRISLSEESGRLWVYFEYYYTTPAPSRFAKKNIKKQE